MLLLILVLLINPHGTLSKSAIYAANFEVRTYVIEQWDGIDTNGITKITAKDILKLASDDRAVAPKASTRQNHTRHDK